MYATLRALHRPGDPLVLPNVWDAGSARAVADAGFPALATASAAVADSLGYADEEGAPAAEMFAAARRVIRAVDVPVTVDAEGGYGLPPDELAARLREIGAAGCNLEDTRDGTYQDIDAQAAYLATLREAAPDLVINARTDAFVHGVPDALDQARARAVRYREAGADCFYPIALDDPAAITDLVRLAPVNVYAAPGADVGRLAALGVARVSFGPGVYRHALASVRAFVRDLPGH
ncbi:isocitrate lyase/PEP mutase family protein [Actinomadura flavalba]|uniref:isocitrate lyase/PEP mutase family protein n=1 Tax=Actinomadura flavalba TaxID=1120938 RepID=UPI00037FF10C|nr:isocitrate lyase/phosphoenolpyruvate mutase family protein [Actinomadura flavalba]